jgi:pectate lyase
MLIKLQNELIVSSFTTIDGRGHNIHIAGGAGFTLHFISNVIIHGLHIYNLVPTGPAMIRSSNSSHVGQRGRADGDGVNIFGSHDVCVDHCYFANGPDGLVDVIQGSTAISISNNYFTQHDKV